MIKMIPRQPANGRRVSAIAALGATVVLALTGFATSASASVASPQKIGQVHCRAYTFNVYHGVRSETCYEGVGSKIVRIPDVRVITTGENSGRFVLVLHHTLVLNVKFIPKHTYRYAQNQAELVAITITRT